MHRANQSTDPRMRQATHAPSMALASKLEGGEVADGQMTISNHGTQTPMKAHVNAHAQATATRLKESQLALCPRASFDVVCGPDVELPRRAPLPVPLLSLPPPPLSPTTSSRSNPPSPPSITRPPPLSPSTRCLRLDFISARTATSLMHRSLSTHSTKLERLLVGGVRSSGNASAAGCGEAASGTVGAGHVGRPGVVECADDDRGGGGGGRVCGGRSAFAPSHASRSLLEPL